ncbi:MAG: hypothetical protein P3W93_000505 [Thermus sp.]|nr:hypothetical protein [Thermus sp.]
MRVLAVDPLGESPHVWDAIGMSVSYFLHPGVFHPVAPRPASQDGEKALEEITRQLWDLWAA